MNSQEIDGVPVTGTPVGSRTDGRPSMYIKEIIGGLPATGILAGYRTVHSSKKKKQSRRVLAWLLKSYQ